MACYPIILLIAGLRQHDISDILSSDTVKHLVANCKNTNNLDSLFPPPLPESYQPGTPFELPNNHHKKQTDKEDYIKHDIGFPNQRGKKYDKPLFSVIKDNLKKFIAGITQNDAAVEKPKSGYGDDIKIEITPLSQSKNNEPQDSVKEKIEKIRADLNINTEVNKKHNTRSGQSIPIPTVDDEVGLVRSFEKRFSFIIISGRFLKGLTHIEDLIKERNPIGVQWNSNPEYFGVSTDYLAKLIVKRVHNLKQIGSKLFAPIVKQFRRLIEAAINYLEEVAEENFNNDHSYTKKNIKLY